MMQLTMFCISMVLRLRLASRNAKCCPEKLTSCLLMFIDVYMKTFSHTQLKSLCWIEPTFAAAVVATIRWRNLLLIFGAPTEPML